MKPEVVVHHLEQAKATLRIADERGVPVQLRSAPGAAASAGVGYLNAVGQAAGHDLLIDCHDDAGLVMAAMRTGCRKLIFRGSKVERQTVREMAERCGTELFGSADRSQVRLDLFPEDDEATIRSRLTSL